LGRLVSFDAAHLDGWRGHGRQGAFTHSFVLRDASANFMADGSAVIVGVRDEEEAVELYNRLLGRNDESLRELERAISEDPGNAMAHRLKSRTLVSMKKYDGALEEAQTAASLDPRGARSHKAVATALYGLGRHAEALESLDAAIALDPEGAGLADRARSARERAGGLAPELRVAAGGAGS